MLASIFLGASQCARCQVHGSMNNSTRCLHHISGVLLTTTFLRSLFMYLLWEPELRACPNCSPNPPRLSPIPSV
ncbi:MAG: hypothetical protein J3Q66DRAFT_341137 [Benniella sp.]|nr:MAG: hypothetical protein J3Q66DRAFT_341137 [Benniella sp.]